MFKKIQFLFCILFSVIFLPAQEYREMFDSLDVARLQVLYDYTFTEDSTHEDWTRQERMVLFIGNHISQFQSYIWYQRSHIMYNKYKDGTYSAWRNTEDEFKYRANSVLYVYKNYPSGKMTYKDYVTMTGNYKYEEEMNAFNWEILDDTLMISGYLCQKAVCQYGGRTWEAWFTDELPFEDGPYKFHGLPGLILKVADTRNHYRFDFVSIEVPPKGTEIEWFYSMGVYDLETTTREEFWRLLRNARMDVINRFDERTSVEFQKLFYYTMKSRNNPIELDCWGK